MPVPFSSVGPATRPSTPSITGLAFTLGKKKYFRRKDVREPQRWLKKYNFPYWQLNELKLFLLAAVQTAFHCQLPQPG
jgi:hypothetical protein